MAQVREKLIAIIKKKVSQSIGFPIKANGKIIAAKMEIRRVILI